MAEFIDARKAATFHDIFCNITILPRLRRYVAFQHNHGHDPQTEADYNHQGNEPVI
jgi:hypothetical protein